MNEKHSLPPDEEDDLQRRWGDRHVDWTKVVAVIATALSIVALIFSLGVNYQKLSAVDGHLSDFIQHADVTYVRRDVESEQVERLTFQIQMLQEQVEMLREEVKAQERPGTPLSLPTPRFR